MAWRVDFHSSNGLNTLWALSSRPTRLKLEQAHRRAAREAIAAVEIVVTDASPEQTAEKGPTALFAAFRGGGFPPRLADLRTTAFLFNLKFHPNGEVSTFDSEKLHKAAYKLLDFYTLIQDVFVFKRIGVPETVIDRDLHDLGVSGALYSKLNLKASASLDVPNFQAMDFADKEERLTHWQRQAQAFGWGTKEAQAYLRYARRDYAIEELMTKCKKMINRGINLVLGPRGFPPRVRDQRSLDLPTSEPIVPVGIFPWRAATSGLCRSRRLRR